MLKRDDVRRVDFGYFVRPAQETGTGQPRVEPALGYVVDHPDGVVLFDTGIGVADADTEAHYRPSRRPLDAALRAAGVAADDVRVVVNCHLHFDHCGGNPQLTGRPILVQATELAAARRTGYTVAALVDFPGASYEQVDGEADLLPGVTIVPTPGHTPGHQALALRCADGTVILAGQAHDCASEYTADQLAWHARRHGAQDPLPSHRAWIARLQRFDPARILFAHDLAVWEPAS